MAFRLDRSTISLPNRRADGSVVYEGPLTRTGVFKYTQPDGSTRLEYRPPGEVGNKDSLATLELAHVCDDHPEARGQAKGRAVGAVAAPRFEDNRLVIGKVMVREDATNAKVASGKCQISCGYDCVLVETPGRTPEGERYDAIQTQIRYEHVAIVAAGRAGPEVRLRLDALEAEDRDDATFRVRGGGCATVTVTSTSLSGVELDGAVSTAIATIPGAYVDTSNSDRADAVKPTTVDAGRWRAPSVWVSSRDLSLDALSSQLAAAMGPGVTVTRGDAASPPLHQDTAAMDLAAQLAAAVKDATEQRARADAADAKTKAVEAEIVTVKGERDQARADAATHKDRADKADQARKDAVDQGPAIARARVELENNVKPILGADFKFDAADGKPLPDIAIRLAVLDKLGVKTEAADRASEVYVKARFDGALDTHAKASGNVDAARGGGGGRTDGKPEMTEAEAMAEARRRADGRSKPTATA